MEAISNFSVKVRKHEGLLSWMKKRNILFSFLCEQEISNFQALLIMQLFTSLTYINVFKFLAYINSIYMCYMVCVFFYVM